VRRTLTDQDDPNHAMTITVTRAGVKRDISFVPEGKTVEAYQWARVPGVADAQCHY
jgi:hypothetical protein